MNKKTNNRIMRGLAAFLLANLVLGCPSPTLEVNQSYENTGYDKIIDDELFEYDREVADLEHRIADAIADSTMATKAAGFSMERTKILGWINALKSKYAGHFSARQTADANALISRLDAVGTAIGYPQEVIDIMNDLNQLETDIDAYDATVIVGTTPTSEIDAKKAEFTSRKDAQQAIVDSLLVGTTGIADLNAKISGITSKITNLGTGMVNPGQLGATETFAHVKELAHSGGTDWAVVPAGYSNLRNITGTASYDDMLAFANLNSQFDNAGGGTFNTSALSVQVADQNVAVLPNDIEKILARASKLTLASNDAARKINFTSGLSGSYQIFDIGKFSQYFDASNPRIAFESGTVFDRPAGYGIVVGSVDPAGVALAKLNGMLAMPVFYSAGIAATKLAGNVAGVESVLGLETSANAITFVPSASFAGASYAAYSLDMSVLAALASRSLKNYKNIDAVGTPVAAGTSLAGIGVEGSVFDVALDGAIFSNASFKDVKFNDDAKATDFTGAKFAKVSFGYGTDLTGALFTGAKFNESGAATDTAIFDSVNLQNADFTGGATQMKNTFFNGARLAGADFTGFRGTNVSFDSTCVLADTGASLFAKFNNAQLTDSVFAAGSALAGVAFDNAQFANTAAFPSTGYNFGAGCNFAAVGVVPATSFKNVTANGMKFANGTFGAADFTGLNGSKVSFGANADLRDVVFENVSLADWLRLNGGTMPVRMGNFSAPGLELNNSTILVGTDVSGMDIDSLKSVNPIGLMNLTVPSGKGACTNYEGKITDYETYWRNVINFSSGNRYWTMAPPSEQIFLALAENIHGLGLAKGC
ncbi:MAG: hypothetical protein LBI17_02030 [Rickettsiales bacterium]|jgi:uncharacterized protein YjbI with pentapeptide repeats|nr:hypothetical protein [Rickettsiales bacterium]